MLEPALLYQLYFRMKFEKFQGLVLCKGFTFLCYLFCYLLYFLPFQDGGANGRWRPITEPRPVHCDFPLAINGIECARIRVAIPIIFYNEIRKVSSTCAL